MTQNRLYLYISLLLTFTLSSCKDSKEYSVNSAFADYLQRFENEGAARGRTFDPKSTGLIIEFANLKDSAAGLTHYEKPIRIEIDKTYWDAISKTAGADMMKEDLIFHELGHGLLNRQHLNSTLPNNDWKSIMCGGDKVNGRSWNINYRGERRKYYLDELFNESTTTPDFASMLLIADTTGYAPLIVSNFDTAAQAIWTLKDTTDHKISLDNGRLRFESKVTDAYFVFLKLKTNPISIQSDFSFEMTFQYPTGSATNQYGLIFGDSYGSSNDSIEYFSINNSQKMFMGNRTWYSFFTELTEPSVISAGVNILKVFKISNMLYYFINNVYCYQSEIVADKDLNQFGFMVPPMCVIWVDNFKISQKSTIKSGSRVKENIQIEGVIQRTNNFNQNKVNNQ